MTRVVLSFPRGALANVAAETREDPATTITGASQFVEPSTLCPGGYLAAGKKEVLLAVSQRSCAIKQLSRTRITHGPGHLSTRILQTSSAASSGLAFFCGSPNTPASAKLSATLGEFSRKQSAARPAGIIKYRGSSPRPRGVIRYF